MCLAQEVLVYGILILQGTTIHSMFKCKQFLEHLLLDSYVEKGYLVWLRLYWLIILVVFIPPCGTASVEALLMFSWIWDYFSITAGMLTWYWWVIGVFFLPEISPSLFKGWGCLHNRWRLSVLASANDCDNPLESFVLLAEWAAGIFDPIFPLPCWNFFFGSVRNILLWWFKNEVKLSQFYCHLRLNWALKIISLLQLW